MPEFIPEMQSVMITDEEFRHCKALRLREESLIMISNGNGMCARTRVANVHAHSLELTPIQFLPNHNESPYRYHLCIGSLDSKDRMEFVVEKAVELGVQSVMIVSTRYSSKKVYNRERLLTKAIAAMKQSCRAHLPDVSIHASLRDALKEISAEDHILCDENGTAPGEIKSETCLYVGPEGGFHENEIELIRALPNSDNWKLSHSRLRAETAALAALSHIAAM